MIKKAILLVLSIIVSATYPLSAFAYSGNGAGSVGDPYRIYTCTQLQEMRDNLTSNFRIEQDVDCTSMTTWEPVGFYSGTPFTGTLDGQGYGIYNLTYDGDGPAGVFGYTNGASVSNLSVISGDIAAAGTAGGVIGDATNTTISHVSTLNTTIRSSYAIGGLVGIADTVTISDSAVYNTTVTTPAVAPFANNFGGLIGQSTGSTVDRTSVSGVVTSNSTLSSSGLGGFIGDSQGDTIRDSYSSAAVTGSSNVGGFIGNGTSSSVDNSYASGAVTGNSNVGGMVGYEGLMGITQSFSTGLVTGNTSVGGFIGHAVAAGTTLTDSTWDITRSGITDCVGLDESISFAATCTGVNTASAQPNYFFNNTTNSPLDQWNFSSIWQTTSTLPILITTPDRVDNVSVVRTSSSLTVRWEVPANTGGSPITSYDLQYRPSSALTSTRVTGLPNSNPSTYTISGLSASTEYIVEIRGHNANGVGIWSGFITTTTAPVAVAVVPTTPKTSTSTPSIISTATESVTEEMAPVSTPVSTNNTTTKSHEEINDCCAETPTNNLPTILWISGGVIVGVGGLIWLLRVLASRRPL